MTLQMTRTLLCAIAAAAGVASLIATVTHANAQNAIAGAGAVSGANSNSGAAAGAVSGSSSINQTFEGARPGRMVQGDNTKATIENVPDIIPPNITHTNPCIISYSAGAGVVGVGAAIGFGIKDENCQDINTGVFLAQLEAGNEAMKGMNLALHFYCKQNEEVREIAMLRGMSDCGQAVPVAAVQPAAFTPPVQTTEPKPAPSGNAKDGRCVLGFDYTTGQCRKQTAFVSDRRADG